MDDKWKNNTTKSSKTQEAFLPAQRSNAQCSVCVNGFLLWEQRCNRAVNFATIDAYELA